jgi:O-antigen/teichoic acid export membrane protein
MGLTFGFARNRLIGTLGATVLMTGLSFITSVLLARNLGPDGRGALLALTFWPALLLGVLSLSLNESTTYHVAHAPGAGRIYAATGLGLQLLVVLAATPLALAIILVFGLGRAHAGIGLMVWYAAFFTPLSLLDLHFKAVLQGRGDFRALNLTRLVQPFGYAVALIALAAAGRFTIAAAMAAMLATLAFSSLVGAAFARPTWARWEGARDILMTGFRFHLANVLFYAASEVDKLIVLALMDDTDVGYYAIGIGLSTLGSGIAVQSISLLMSRDMPAAAEEARIDLLARNLAIGGLLLIGINLVGALSASWWLPAIYGAQFKPATPVVTLLLIMGTIKGLRQIIDRAMRAARIVKVGILGELTALTGLVVFGCAGAFAGGLEGLVCGLIAAQLIALLAIWHLTARALATSPRRLASVCRAGVVRLGGPGSFPFRQLFGGLS